MTQLARAGDESSDEELIERWQGGDERAATALVTRHAPALGRYASSLGAWTEVDELVQDTFVRAFKSLDSFRRDASLRTWLFTILRRLLLDRRRAAQRERAATGPAGGDPTTSHDALDALLADEASRRLGRAVQGLTPMQREVFTLRVSEGVAYRDIAELLGTTEGAARVHYHNAVRAVKEALND